MEGLVPVVEESGPHCQVCGSPLTNPKKYQIHKIDQGYSLGGKPFVLQTLPNNPEGHACHKCYQANLKARKRMQPDLNPGEGVAPPLAKRPIRRIEPPRPLLPLEHAVLGIKALTNLANLVTSSCTQCHGQWLHLIEAPTNSSELIEFEFSCHLGHTIKWSSDNNELLLLEPPQEPEPEVLEVEHENHDEEPNGPFSGATT